MLRSGLPGMSPGDSRRVSASEVVPREITQQRLNRGYAPIVGYRRDQPYSVADMLEERAVDAAGQAFVVFEGRSLSFAQLNAPANRVAHAALAAGLKPGSVVALMMDNRPEFPMVWLGLAKVGIVTALLNTSARGPVLQHALAQTARTGADLRRRVRRSRGEPHTGRTAAAAVLGAPSGRCPGAGDARRRLAGCRHGCGEPREPGRAASARRCASGSALLHLHLRHDRPAQGRADESPALPERRRASSRDSST